MNKMDIKSEINLEEKSIVAVSNTEEEPLGSLTLSDVPESKGQQLRSSARVFKKMKLDSTAPVVPEKTEKKEEKPESKKCFRPLWSSEDKNVFFEALNEYGKDFESIQLYISNKFRKKGVPDHFAKTKDQIRHLYYRTWQKISKYLKFSEGIKKVTQELYGLINYGELRKKLGSVNVKYLLKLNKLIYKGSIILRVKGKSIKVKTPYCRALRKLNQLDDKYEEIRLPNRLTVELRPKDMASFLKVQSVAQNPRLKTYMPLQKRLSSLIDCLSKRWKSVEANVYDKALISTSITINSIPTEQEIQINKERLNPLLRITPPVDCKIEVPSISLGEYFSRQSMCFNSYENRLMSNYKAYRNCDNYKIINKTTKKGGRSRTDSASEKLQKNGVNVEEDVCDNIVAAENETSNETTKDASKETSKKSESSEHNTEEVKVQDDKTAIDNDNTEKLERQERIETLRRGWTIKNSESITMGEIYLMCGSNSKLVLEYSWDPEPIPESELNNKLEPDISDTPNYGQNLDLSEPLLKLLSVAKLHYRKNIIKCPCGHVCGTKNNAQLKRDVESKIRKILTDIDKCSEDTDEKGANGEHIFENPREFVRPTPYVQPKLPGTSFYQANASHFVSKIDSIQSLTPGYYNKKGRRPRSKQVVVERKLPILPNNVGSGHQIVRMNIISKDNPKPPDPKKVATTSNIFNSNEQPSTSTSNTDFSNKSEEISVENFNNSSIDIKPVSPTRILNETDQWINSEVEDYSLSSLLGHLESPVKTSTSIIINEDSRMFQDVDAQLHSMLTQNSVDFSASFADLAAEVARDTKCELG
ncbi:protein cramped isoform X1 [Diorhabda sublineata]|uniref:protein cramped isoform X1 n=1 Tax=Diorhabda sublineata TaxID=1163346 RepID=UPI0024E13B6C|nr:protein cramped isoform X1 [Diorhabda sublineata]